MGAKIYFVLVLSFYFHVFVFLFFCVFVSLSLSLSLSLLAVYELIYIAFSFTRRLDFVPLAGRIIVFSMPDLVLLSGAEPRLTLYS